MAVAKRPGPRCRAGNPVHAGPAEAIKLEPRDPVLRFIQRLRDEAHRFVIGSHRKLRKKTSEEAGLQEIRASARHANGALLHHFGTLKEIERASIADLGKVQALAPKAPARFLSFSMHKPG